MKSTFYVTAFLSALPLRTLKHMQSELLGQTCPDIPFLFKVNESRVFQTLSWTWLSEQPTWFSPSDRLWSGSLVADRRTRIRNTNLNSLIFLKSSFPLGLMYQTPLLGRVTWFSCKAWVSNLWDGNENTFPPKTTEGSRWHMQQAWSQGAECKPSLSCYGLLSINLLISHCCKLYLSCPGWVFSHSKCSI